jgi:mannose-6-phosphate isomerase-like protein (cupin superfamily)
MIIKKGQAKHETKFGVDMWIYTETSQSPAASIVYEETDQGHCEEFYHQKSYYIFYILEGQGTWVIDGVDYLVEATDLVIIPPGVKFYYKGNLKQVCITSPAWDPNYECHVRNIEL